MGVRDKLLVDGVSLVKVALRYEAHTWLLWITGGPLDLQNGYEEKGSAVEDERKLGGVMKSGNLQVEIS